MDIFNIFCTLFEPYRTQMCFIGPFYLIVYCWYNFIALWEILWQNLGHHKHGIFSSGLITIVKVADIVLV